MGKYDFSPIPRLNLRCSAVKVTTYDAHTDF